MISRRKRSQAVNFGIAVLAVDRIARLIVEDEITRPIREAISERWPDSKMSYLVSCKACVSVWGGLAVCSGKMPRPVIYALAASATVLLIDRQDERVGSLVSAYRRKAASGNLQ